MLTGDSVPAASAQTLPRRHFCEELTIPIVHKNHHLKTYNTLLTPLKQSVQLKEKLPCVI